VTGLVSSQFFPERFVYLPIIISTLCILFHYTQCRNCRLTISLKRKNHGP
jgi:hypothetical protein